MGIPDSTPLMSNVASWSGLPLNLTSRISSLPNHKSCEGSIITLSMTIVSRGEVLGGSGRWTRNSLARESPLIARTTRRKTDDPTGTFTTPQNAPLGYTFISLPLINAFAVGRVDAETRCRGDPVTEVSDYGTITRRKSESAGCAEEEWDAHVSY